MDVDILDQVEEWNKDSEDEESETEEDGTAESAPETSLEILRRRVEENLKILCNPSPIDASPLLLSKLREKYPQASSTICMVLAILISP